MQNHQRQYQQSAWSQNQSQAQSNQWEEKNRRHSKDGKVVYMDGFSEDVDAKARQLAKIKWSTYKNSKQARLCSACEHTGMVITHCAETGSSYAFSCMACPVAQETGLADSIPRYEGEEVRAKFVFRRIF